jgi:hypothetical protein
MVVVAMIIPALQPERLKQFFHDGPFYNFGF